MAKKYEYYTLMAVRGDNPLIEFRVRGTSHTQHIWNKTRINGLAKSATAKIRAFKQAGYSVFTTINGRHVRIEN